MRAIKVRSPEEAWALLQECQQSGLPASRLVGRKPSVGISPTVNSAVGRAVGLCLAGGVRQATVYLSADLMVKATLQHRLDRREKLVTVLVSIGAPGYRGERVIRRLAKSGGKYPHLEAQRE